MKKLICLALLILAAGSARAGDTNLPAPSTFTMMTDSNGVVVAPPLAAWKGSNDVASKSALDSNIEVTGFAWSNSLSRFVARTDGTVEDMDTGLMWDREAGRGYMVWSNALAIIATLNSTNYLGYSDWRLPTVNNLKADGSMGAPELETLMHFGGVLSNPVQAPDFPFFNVSSNQYVGYWSSLSNVSSSGSAWQFSFYSGAPVSAPVYPSFPVAQGYVWPVRAGLPIAKTGDAMANKDVNLNKHSISNGAFLGDGTGLTGLVGRIVTNADVFTYVPRWIGEVLVDVGSNKTYAAYDATTNGWH